MSEETIQVGTEIAAFVYRVFLFDFGFPKIQKLQLTFSANYYSSTRMQPITVAVTKLNISHVLGLMILIAHFFIISLIANIAVALTDVLAFLAVIRQVWGLWKEKRRLGLHDKDFVSLILQQGILRFSFVLLVTITQIIISYISPIAGTDVTAFQNVLSALLICEFTMDLRRRNTTESLPSTLSALEFPDLSLSFQHNPAQFTRSVLGRIHQGIIDDMSERNTFVYVDGLDEGESN
ncbi:hypothetical protein Clacol_004334 [Clathrus columnatus]|uniref:Uncharacterized protein n=1 Tax=Clathrus columnatus TaxID=1419009 RepID=A0AAV5ABU8_9AGAM|nr:hypothetical protein Clacol_004334 [Clathrus columnatus]